VRDELLVFFIRLYLLLNLLPLLLAKKRRIQLVSEGSGHGRDCPGTQACHPSGLVVWHRRHVGAYRTGWIEERCSILYAQSVHRIRIVTAPYLWRVIEHSCVKSAAATAAALNEHIRIAGAKPLCKIIHAQNVIVSHTPVVHVSHAPIHIPLHILHVALIQHSADLLKNVVPNLRTGKIQQQLIARADRRASVDL